MNIDYEISTLSNSAGTGNERQFVRLNTARPLTAEQIAQQIQESASATAGDVKAVMSALRSLVRHELCMGRRVYLPEIGYLSLSVGIAKDKRQAGGRVTGRDISVRGINFKPEASLLAQVKNGVSFAKSGRPARKATLGDEELRRNISTLAQSEGYVTTRSLMAALGLSYYRASRALKAMAAGGQLLQKGSHRRAIYLPAPAPQGGDGKRE